MVILMGTFTSSVALRIFNIQIIVKNSTERHSFREGPARGLASVELPCYSHFTWFSCIWCTSLHSGSSCSWGSSLCSVHSNTMTLPSCFLLHIYLPFFVNSPWLPWSPPHPCFWLSFCITWRQHETQVTIFIYSGSKPQRQTSIQGGDFKVTLRTCRGISEAELLQVYCSSICEAIKLKPSHWCEWRASLTQEPTQRKRRWEGRGTGPQEHLLRPH